MIVDKKYVEGLIQDADARIESLVDRLTEIVKSGSYTDLMLAQYQRDIRLEAVKREKLIRITQDMASGTRYQLIRVGEQRKPAKTNKK